MLSIGGGGTIERCLEIAQRGKVRVAGNPLRLIGRLLVRIGMICPAAGIEQAWILRDEPRGSAGCRGATAQRRGGTAQGPEALAHAVERTDEAEREHAVEITRAEHPPWRRLPDQDRVCARRVARLEQRPPSSVEQGPVQAR